MVYGTSMVQSLDDNEVCLPDIWAVIFSRSFYRRPIKLKGAIKKIKRGPIRPKGQVWWPIRAIHRMQIWRTTRSALGTSCMNSVIARDELHESEASEESVFCFDNASPEKSCFVDGLVCFISLCLRVFEFRNATRREWSLPQERESFFSFPVCLWAEYRGVHDPRANCKSFSTFQARIS